MSSATPEPDALLVERVRGGDAEAFGELVRRHLRAANAIALAVVGSSADAEDVCQDAFITALERLDDCREPDRFPAWLLRIVRNRALSFRRYRKVRDALPLDAADREPGRDNPALDTERALLRERLLIAMEDLTEVQREVVLLHDLEGWRHREIAVLLGLPEGTVRAHLSRARHTLRGSLGAELKKEG